MKKTLIVLTAALALLAGCTTTSQIKGTDGSVQNVTDFKASADANAKMYAAQADVMWNAQEAVKACYTGATTDVSRMACGMVAQSTNFAQALSGRPTPNRNPQSGTEANAEVGKAAIGGLSKVGQVAAVATAAAKVSENVAGVQAKDPVVTVTKEPVMVEKPVIVTVPEGSAILTPTPAPTPTP